MTIKPMTFDEVKEVFRNALDKANTPTEFIQNILTISYEKSYDDAKKQWHSIEKEEREMNYKRGLDDAWECARKVVFMPDEGGLTVEELDIIFGKRPCCANTILNEFTASEAVAKIKEYEDKHKCKECKWDEFRDAQSPVGTPCDSCFEGKNFSPSEATICSILEDDCPYNIKCEECEVHCSFERAEQKLKEIRNNA